MPSRAQALDAVKIGDLIFGIRGDARTDLLLVYRTRGDAFWARNVLNQATYKFNRDGMGRRLEDGRSCTIVSTARLPPDMYEVALGLDRKFAARPEYPDSILTKAEIQLVLTHDKFFKANLIPGTEPVVKAAEKLNAVGEILQLEWDPINARDDPPGWNEYLGDLPALVNLLDRQASVEVVAGLLADMAAQRMRTRQVADRGNAAAASLVRLRQSWT